MTLAGVASPELSKAHVRAIVEYAWDFLDTDRFRFRRGMTQR
jgi:hypothetical protein